MGGFKQMTKVPAIGALEQEINDLVSSSGLKVPSDYFDRWIREVYGDEADGLLDVFGCENNADGSPRDCQDILDRFLTASQGLKLLLNIFIKFKNICCFINIF